MPALPDSDTLLTVYLLCAAVALAYLGDRLHAAIRIDLADRERAEDPRASWSYHPRVTVGRVVADLLRGLTPGVNAYYALRGVVKLFGGVAWWLECTLSKPLVPRHERKPTDRSTP